MHTTPEAILCMRMITIQLGGITLEEWWWPYLSGTFVVAICISLKALVCCLQLSCTCCGQGVLRTTVVGYQKSTGTSNRPPSSMIYWIYTWDVCCTTRFICTRVTSRILWGGRHGKSSHCTTILTHRSSWFRISSMGSPHKVPQVSSG